MQGDLAVVVRVLCGPLGGAASHGFQGFYTAGRELQGPRELPWLSLASTLTGILEQFVPLLPCVNKDLF